MVSPQKIFSEKMQNYATRVRWGRTVTPGARFGRGHQYRLQRQLPRAAVCYWVPMLGSSNQGFLSSSDAWTPSPAKEPHFQYIPLFTNAPPPSHPGNMPPTFSVISGFTFFAHGFICAARFSEKQTVSPHHGAPFFHNAYQRPSIFSDTATPSAVLRVPRALPPLPGRARRLNSGSEKRHLRRVEIPSVPPETRSPNSISTNPRERVWLLRWLAKSFSQVRFLDAENPTP